MKSQDENRPHTNLVIFMLKGHHSKTEPLPPNGTRFAVNPIEYLSIESRTTQVNSVNQVNSLEDQWHLANLRRLLGSSHWKSSGLAFLAKKPVH